MQINSLADLFTLDLRSLPFSNFRSDNTTVIQVKATVFSAADKDVQLTCLVQDGQLASVLAASLPPLSLQQLAGHLPQSSYQATDLPAITFSNINVTLDQAFRVATLTGSAPVDLLNLGIASLPVLNGSLYLRVAVLADNTIQNLDAAIRGTLGIGSGLAVQLLLPAGLSDWQLIANDGASIALPSGLNELTALIGGSVNMVLPDGLPTLTGLTLNHPVIQFSTQTMTISSISLQLATANEWPITSALHVKQLTVDLSFLYSAGTTTITGAIAGLFTFPGDRYRAIDPYPSRRG